MTALEKLATPGRHVNVMTHMLGHFTDRLEPAARQAILEVIEDYRRGLVPLIAPLTLVRHYVRMLEGGVPPRTDLSRPAPQGADAAQPRLTPSASRGHLADEGGEGGGGIPAARTPRPAGPPRA